MSSMSTQSEKTCKGERLRFSRDEDLILLRDVIAYNPFEDLKRWQMVNRNLIKATGRPFTLRAMKDRVEYMLKVFSREDTKNKKKSGTEEEYTEKDRLLQEVKDLQRDFKKQKVHTRDNGREKGQLLRLEATTISSCAATASEYQPNNANSCGEGQIRDETMDLEEEELNVNIEEEEPIVEIQSNSRQQILQPSHTRRARNDSTKMKNSALLYLENKNSAEQEHKKRILELEERKLALDERKVALEEARFDLDKQERLERVKMDRQLHEKILEFQDQLVSKLLTSKINV